MFWSCVYVCDLFLFDPRSVYRRAQLIHLRVAQGLLKKDELRAARDAHVKIRGADALHPLRITA